MFQSAHPMGAYHAAARAVSGSPVYVSDEPGRHDFGVLKKLVLSDGSVLRAREVGRPTRDCLFHDPTKEDILLKIFNTNLEAGVVGVFHARYDGEGRPIGGTVSPSDVHGLAGADFAVYAHHARTLVRAKAEQRLPVRLDELTAEVFTIVPIDGGVAPVGLADKLNSAGAITQKGWRGATYVASLRDGGTFLAFCERKPAAVLSDGVEQAFSYDPSGRLRVELKKEGVQEVHIVDVGPM
jgi:raffinose synthase